MGYPERILLLRDANMSTQTIQVPLPCANEVWEATTEAAWETAQASHAEPPNFHDTVKSLVEERDSFHRDPMDRLSLALLLHGPMSMCNDIAHFDNRSIYLGDMDHGEVSWTPWRRVLGQKLTVWLWRVCPDYSFGHGSECLLLLCQSES